MSQIIGDQAQPSLIKDATIETFEKDVIEASMAAPVIVDFWATWCGPCKTLTPILEKVVNEAAGAVTLVKVDIDKNQMLASQLRIQSVPTVYAFFQGRPIDGFQGALPESEIRAFVDRLKTAAGGAGGAQPNLDEVLAAAEAALEAGQTPEAAQAFAGVAQATAQDEDGPNIRAIAGLAKCHITMNEIDQARQIIDMIPEEKRGDQALASILATLELAGSGDAGELGALKAKAEANPADHQARFDYAEALIGAGEMEAGVFALLDMIADDREWEEEAARKKLLTVFEALGPTDPVTLKGRRRLSSLLFS